VGFLELSLQIDLAAYIAVLFHIWVLRTKYKCMLSKWTWTVMSWRS